ncbi:MAG TPA: DUF2933 domain-containing protein [Pseudomonadales bacterium]|nr:DUF2933 domain-containing protein [Pseudomonadales bacterium]
MVACIVVSVIGFLIYTGHGAHMLGFLPYLILLACPLMHIFMHGGHGRHQHGEQKDAAHGDCCGGHSHSEKTAPQDSASDSNRPQGGQS